MPDVEPALIHWRGSGVSVLIDCQGDGLPRIPYWGADLGPLTGEDLVSVALAVCRNRGPTRPMTGSRSASCPSSPADGWARRVCRAIATQAHGPRASSPGAGTSASLQQQPSRPLRTGSG